MSREKNLTIFLYLYQHTCSTFDMNTLISHNFSHFAIGVQVGFDFDEEFDLRSLRISRLHNLHKLQFCQGSNTHSLNIFWDHLNLAIPVGWRLD